MDLHSRNGNGGAATILPPPPKVITGASLVHRRLDKHQRACLAANIIDGLVRFVPTNQLATICGVSQPYVDTARKLTPGKREAILHGLDSTSFVDLMHPQRQLRLKLPVPMCASVTNLQLEHVIRTVGVERVLEAAVAVERFDETLAPAL